MVRGTALCRARLLQTALCRARLLQSVCNNRARQSAVFATIGPDKAPCLQQSGPTKRRTSFATIGPDKAPYLVCCLQQSGPTKRRRARLLHRTSFGVCNNRARQSAVPRLIVRFIVKRPRQWLWSCRDGQLTYPHYFPGQA